MNLRTIDTKFKVTEMVTVRSETLMRLTTHLEEFQHTTPCLYHFNGTGGIKDGHFQYAVATDGIHAVLVNAEGYTYPRYRSPRIAVGLLPQITEDQANRLCVRKSIWPKDFSIETAEQLKDVAARCHEIVL